MISSGASDIEKLSESTSSIKNEFRIVKIIINLISEDKITKWIHKHYRVKLREYDSFIKKEEKLNEIKSKKVKQLKKNRNVLEKRIKGTFNI